MVYSAFTCLGIKYRITCHLMKSKTRFIQDKGIELLWRLCRCITKQNYRWVKCRQESKDAFSISPATLWGVKTTSTLLLHDGFFFLFWEQKWLHERESQWLDQIVVQLLLVCPPFIPGNEINEAKERELWQSKFKAEMSCILHLPTQHLRWILRTCEKE